MASNKKSNSTALITITGVCLLTIFAFISAGRAVYGYLDDEGKNRFIGTVSSVECDEGKIRGDILSMVVTNETKRQEFSIGGMFTCENLDLESNFVRQEADIVTDNRGQMISLMISGKEFYSERETALIRLIASLFVTLSLVALTLMLFRAYRSQK